jgi:hypothetical protein
MNGISWYGLGGAIRNDMTIEGYQNIDIQAGLEFYFFCYFP